MIAAALRRPDRRRSSGFKIAKNHRPVNPATISKIAPFRFACVGWGMPVFPFAEGNQWYTVLQTKESKRVG
jgi:hypothetical protein